MLIFQISTTAGEHALPVSVKGVLDLRDYVMDSQSLFNLNGEWIFHWETLISPDNLDEIREQDPGIVVSVPSYWNSYEIDDESLPGTGYGTYSLILILPENHQSAICFDIPVFDVAYKFYLNDKLIGSNGEVGTSRDEEKPWNAPSSFCFMPNSDTLQILIQVSNFHHRRGGFWKAIYTGGSEKVLERMEHRRMYNYSTIGVLFFFILFYLTFWFFSKWDKMMLLFAFTVFGILMRSVNSGLYFSNSFVEAPWAWQIRMEYLGSYLAFVFGMMFLHRIFPANYMKHVIRVNTFIFALASVSLFILPVRLFSYEMLFFQPLIMLFLLHYLVRSLIGTFRRKTIDTIFFFSLGLFIYTLVNDILLANSAGAIHNNYLLQLSFQLFILIMAVIIIMQWVQNYNTRLQLESSLRFKNKVLSVIAHDLKNPVASVAQFSELLEEKPELAGKKHIIRSLRESSQAAVTLLDNLLYWGRSQADELIVKPQVFDVRKLVLNVESLYAHMASQKELEFKIDLGPELSAYADKALINIAIRNLVSNAIKFTPRKGSVHIRAFQEGDRVRFEIIDTGLGIKPEILDQFDKNGLMETTTGTEREIGTGLGLQLVRDLVTKNGGALSINSTPNEGSTFTFTLPQK